ncbi:membrane protein [Ferrigenium kumadai]|uniref:Membrane protein n=1 Tax=Ferrigenium kumadai TaxID=1682490 RepID=A0AAN1T076_9PROT|nr:YdcF family protein [Ferrigenium kumadai]BBJ00316.1 membrane protein [Ferrigenium kumadai]
MSWFTTNTVAAFLLPPLSLLLVLALGIFLLYRRKKSAKAVLLTALALLWLASTPYVAESGLHLLEERTSIPDIQRQQADAIVILGGGTYFHAPDYAGQDTVSEPTLVRLRYGARLQRETGKPILVSGGKPHGNQLSEAQQMKVALEQDFRIPVRWTEDTSDNTFENAHHSFRMLQQQGIRKIYLVTHGWHMPRAAEVFRRAGFEVVEAPTAFTTRYRTDLLAFLPRAESLVDSKIFVHEAIGLLWYRIRSTISN